MIKEDENWDWLLEVDIGEPELSVRFTPNYEIRVRSVQPIPDNPITEDEDLSWLLDC